MISLLYVTNMDKKLIKKVSLSLGEHDVTEKSEILEGLSLVECAVGIQKIIYNCESFLEDAEYFIRIKKNERAAFFAISALEEYSKINRILMNVMTKFSSKESLKAATKSFINKFKNHREKQIMGLSLLQEQYTIFQRNSNLKQFIKTLDESLNLAKKSQKMLETTRQDGLYVKYFNGKFISPIEAFEKNEYIKKNLSKIIRDLKQMIRDARHVYGTDTKKACSVLCFMRALIITPKEKWKISLHLV